MLDAGVPASVGHSLKELGQEVVFYNDVLAESASDMVVAMTALANDAVLLAIDKDLRRIARKYGETPQDERFSKLNLIHFCCDEVLASKRVEHAFSFIQAEWAFCLEKRSRRMWVEIGAHHLKTFR